MFERWPNKRNEEQKSEIVENEEKARVMAEAEDPDREYLTEFRAYIEDPAAYRAAEHARAEEARSRGTMLYENADDFMHLYASGIRSSDIEELAVRAGELAGASYDIDKGFKDVSPAQLKVWIAGLKFIEKWKERKLHAAEKRAGWKISLVTDPRGVVVADKVRRIQGADDPDVEAYDHAYAAYETIHRIIGQLETLLASRQSKAA